MYFEKKQLVSFNKMADLLVIIKLKFKTFNDNVKKCYFTGEFKSDNNYIT